MAFRIVNIGDSVPWGQGLPEEQKYDRLVRDAVAAQLGEVTFHRLAHSGAVIDDHHASGDPAPGEVPVSRPTVTDQCESFTDAPETVDLVLVNGGINDVSVVNILNPFALLPPLGMRIKSACLDNMGGLLAKVRARFSKPSCRILVTGYYTILSRFSDPVNLKRLLEVYGIFTPSFMAEQELLDPVVDRCEQFFHDSNRHLFDAVRRIGDARIRFVHSGFTDENAAFVDGTALLWGLTHLLGPQDPVAETRRPQCDMTFSEPVEFIHRETCHRASAGHPNVRGAEKYRDQILAALTET